MKVLIEVRPGEGGDDARLLVKRQSAIYLQYANRNGLAASVETRGHL